MGNRDRRERMDIITTARRFDLTPPLREHAQKRLQKLGRFSDHIQEVHLILTQDKHRHIAEVTVHTAGTELISKEETHDMVESIDRVCDRIEKQISKVYARMRDRKSRAPVAAMEAPVPEETIPESEVEEEWAPVVVRGKEWHPDPISVDDAIRRLRESEQDFLLFRNVRSGNVSLVHLRADGNFGLVDAE
jgi:putative sigma-54 modulation protein